MIVALPQTIAVSRYVSSEYANVSRWESVAQAVSIKFTQQGNSDAYSESFLRLYRVLAQHEEAAIDQSIASMVLPEQYVHGTGTHRTYTIPGGYSDIVMVNDTFLKAMKLSPTANLKSVDISQRNESREFTRAISDQLKEYNSVWSDGKNFDFCHHLYDWVGASRLPVLGAASSTDSSQITYTRKPLVIFLDQASSLHLSKGYVPAAISQGTIFFTDQTHLAQQIRTNNLEPAIESTLSIADSALLEAQRMSQEVVAGVVSIAVAAISLILCSFQSAWIWAQERRKVIFLRHAAGQSFSRILAVHFVIQAVIFIVIAVGFSLTWMWKNAVSQPLALLSLIVLVCFAIEVGAGMISTSRAFKSVVKREE